MAWDELIRIAGQNRIVTIYGKAEVKEVAKDSEVTFKLSKYGLG